jgi:hypothetical protein
MKLHVAHDKEGRILGAAVVGPKGAGDRPVARPGLLVAELEVPTEFAGKELSEFVHRLRVDVQGQKLVAKR